ncbi:hypothetical protein PoB_000453700 [Plakobranchus ocellatus]|uniref:Uncharacterized protein n=1 Tax=Plakobranchus ocellatus TaxID=259542 RepID=A0AAV3Y5H2_9GAST|nr:hypothetical protein PoB_000453700 [Plakobranchus ocellatus]
MCKHHVSISLAKPSRQRPLLPAAATTALAGTTTMSIVLDKCSDRPHNKLTSCGVSNQKFVLRIARALLYYMIVRTDWRRQPDMHGGQREYCSRITALTHATKENGKWLVDRERMER